MNSKRSDKRWKHIEAALRLTWASLETHLSYTHGKHADGRRFHRKTVREYIDLLQHIIKSTKGK